MKTEASHYYISLRLLKLVILSVALVLSLFQFNTVDADQVTVPGTIPSDCSADVTNALSNWIATVPDNSTLVFSAGSCYRIDETLVFDSRNNLTLEGNGVTFRAVTDGRETDNPRARSHLQFIKGSNIIVRNVIVDGANPNAGTGDAAYVADLEAQHTFQVTGVQGLLLDNVRATEPYGDFVYIGPYRGTPRILPNNITVRNSTFEKNGRQGLAITGGTNILFENNTMSLTRRSSIDIEPNFTDDDVRNVTIRNNTFNDGRLLFFANGGAAAPISDITIEGNTGNKEPSIEVTTPSGAARRQRYKFINNNMQNDFGGPIPSNPPGLTCAAIWRFKGIDDLEIRGNSLFAQINRTMCMIYMENSNNVRITDNRTTGADATLEASRLSTNTGYCVWKNTIGYNPEYIETTSVPQCPHPSVVGFSWYSDGSFAKSGPSGTVIVVYATQAKSNTQYKLVTGTNGGDPNASPCSANIVDVNPNVRTSNSSGFISNTAGTVNRLPGTYNVCFRSLDGTNTIPASITNPVTFTVI